ncbi:hypothetical protein K7432_012407 [Basidiobolus ranarum]|uniref:Uncharacterized protein n=1 Tax=Basidiobolus ranarum TaxID=34480 RepID=A0ABR2WKZ5_9FUNG
MFTRTVIPALAFCGLTLGATQFSLQCGSAAQKCSSSISLGTRNCYVSGTTVHGPECDVPGPALDELRQLQIMLSYSMQRLEHFEGIR